MRSKVVWGAVAGLIAGVVFGVMMQMMMTPAGGQVPMMLMVAKVVRSDSMFVGWIYHLFNSAIIGAIFGWLLGSRVHAYGPGFGWGALYGVAWWILGGQILMPLLLGMPPFASLMMATMRATAVVSLIGHLVYGLVLGGVFVMFRPTAARGSEDVRRPTAAWSGLGSVGGAGPPSASSRRR